MLLPSKLVSGVNPPCVSMKPTGAGSMRTSPPNLLAKTLTNKESRSQGILSADKALSLLILASAQSALNRRRGSRGGLSASGPRLSLFRLGRSLPEIDRGAVRQTAPRKDNLYVYV
jgi:hypothetical protein